jgi:hypothetical protein
MHAQLQAHLFRSPKRYVSDGRFTPEGTVQFQHTLSIEGSSQVFYCDQDLTGGLNGQRDLLDQGNAVPVLATLDFYVTKAGKIQAGDLVALAPVKS